MLDKNRPVCWSIVVNKKPPVCCPPFRKFPAGRVLKLTKDINAHFCIHSNNSCKLYQRIPRYFRRYYEQFVYIAPHTLLRVSRSPEYIYMHKKNTSEMLHFPKDINFHFPHTRLPPSHSLYIATPIPPHSNMKRVEQQHNR